MAVAPATKSLAERAALLEREAKGGDPRAQRHLAAIRQALDRHERGSGRRTAA